MSSDTQSRQRYDLSFKSPVDLARRNSKQKGQFVWSVAAACIIMFAEGFNATMNFPYASFLVEHLCGTDTNLGFRTGIFFTAYPIGTLLTARAWGSKSNDIGRRTCILLSLCSSIFFTIANVICPSYPLMVLLRTGQGVMTCSLPTARTFLRERVDELNGDEVLAFTTLQTAFAASAFTGPAIGGIMYGTNTGYNFLQPWAAPQLIGLVLYILALIFTFMFVVETADLSVSSETRRERAKGVSLLKDKHLLYFFAMVLGHSYVFTGWEVGYPLLARSRSGESWTPKMIGLTFFIGSLGLLFHTLFTYATIVRRLGLGIFWGLSWILCICILILFPRVLNSILASGLGNESWSVYSANYISQLCVSVSQGCNFTTLQLLLNRLISERLDAELALPIANGWVASLQGVARAFAPMTSGALAVDPSILGGLLGFDVLAAIAAVCCLLCGWMLHLHMSREAGRSVTWKSEANFKLLEDEEDEE